ncbi:MAG TPA: gephyrin-like molybdotransferase Glp [Acidobacteriaceae bacterium]|nr:gephyrin-like molybdotransferase Glp [Acidobacteriaceae bacterium]
MTPEESPSIVLSYDHAASVVHRQAVRAREEASRKPNVEKVPLGEAAGRVLAEPVVADRDQPPFPRATRDGYACRLADLDAGGLRVVGLLRAGEAWTLGAIRPGEAVEIMTGAAVPPGADCVVMVEHVVSGEEHISLAEGREMTAGENIVPAGAEARAGDVVVPAGGRIGIAEVAAAAACGAAQLAVFGRPRVAILATGDELVELDRKPAPHQIRNSNSYSLAAQVRAAGGEPIVLPPVHDDLAATERAIRDARDCDLIVLTGGVSMGKYDFVEQALVRLGSEFYFTGAKIQPGKPVVFGMLGDTHFLGLPGNPISTIVTFTLFGAPLLRALGGESDERPRFTLARLEKEVRVKPGLTRFLPAIVVSSFRGVHVRQIGWQGSGDLAAAARANGFLVVPDTVERLAAGEIVTVLEI